MQLSHECVSAKECATTQTLTKYVLFTSTKYVLLVLGLVAYMTMHVLFVHSLPVLIVKTVTLSAVLCRID
eukprot:SAG31_NODE_1756_length_7343_cov_2.790309_7_plen_70_part_00